ncbi:hypothetical protein [Maribacter sp. 2308TA10-17]|uniref:hypothetical protein n=1 Tax=Maribacter sp. 2308TA10-17 TaxID=3386276 RepID=UPI0039BC7726
MIKQTQIMNHAIQKQAHSLLLASLCFFMFSGYSFAQEEASVQVLAKSASNKIMLRWAANTPFAWKKGNELGYLVERYTVSRNGNAVIPVESTMITSYPLKPKPLEEWETLATSDDNAAVIAQAIYGEGFETSTIGSADNILAMNSQLEQRFTFSLMAAEQNYEAAKLAGWAFEDKSVIAGEKYLYKIRIAIPTDSSLQIKEGSAYASTEFFEELPKPLGFASIFADGNVMLNWDFSLLKQTYSTYLLEKSTDGTNFQQVNGQPIFNAEETKEGKQVSLFYNDSIPNNKKFYYRVKGITPFGEIGPASNVESGMGKDVLDFTPHITRKRIPTDETVEIEWEFSEEGNDKITGFELKRANKAEGPYETVVNNIPSTNRKISYTGLKRINYFVVMALGKNGTQKPSFPAIVQPVDSIPPKTPIELTGTIDTTGIVQLSWKANEELDLSGYRVFRANNPDAEFSQRTLEPNRKNTYIDTLQVKNLNTNIYYKVMAVDQRYNQSELSEMLTIEKPDLIPPSSPVIQNYTSTEEGIQLNWVPSSSEDVTGHTVYRKALASEEERWEEIVVIKIEENTTSYIDAAVIPNQSYAYTIVAKDKTGWESTPSDQLVVKAPKKLFGDYITRFNGIADRELRFIRLSWKAESTNASEFLIYRATGENPLTLYKTVSAEENNFVDTNLVINKMYTYGLRLVEKDGTQSQLKKAKVSY